MCRIVENEEVCFGHGKDCMDCTNYDAFFLFLSTDFTDCTDYTDYTDYTDKNFGVSNLKFKISFLIKI